jgi:nicotinamidase-related amidase
VFGDKNLPLLEGVELWSGYCGPVGWNAVPHIQALMREARAAGIPICHATGLLDEESGIVGWSPALHPNRTRGAKPRDAAAQDRHARRYDIIDEVAPQAGDVVVRKTAPSAFWGTPLIAELNRLGIDTLLVTGESTSGCVRATVVDAASYRFRVQVIEDCVFDRHEACHAMNLFDMDQKYADVIPVGTAIDYLRGLKSGATEERELVRS